MSDLLVRLVEAELEYRRMGYNVIAGVDEAGRGPLAGPVVAAAVVVNLEEIIDGVNDSKKLSPKKREILFDRLQQEAVSIGVGIVGSQEIDLHGISKANSRAMKIAVEQLSIIPDLVLVDGIVVPDLKTLAKAECHGDSRYYSIACASIVAKVTRDRIMEQLDNDYPDYGFKKHKGYGTAQHISAIRQFGLCPCHRITFCSQFVPKESSL